MLHEGFTDVGSSTHHFSHPRIHHLDATRLRGKRSPHHSASPFSSHPKRKRFHLLLYVIPWLILMIIISGVIWLMVELQTSSTTTAGRSPAAHHGDYGTPYPSSTSDQQIDEVGIGVPFSATNQRGEIHHTSQLVRTAKASHKHKVSFSHGERDGGKATLQLSVEELLQRLIQTFPSLETEIVKHMRNEGYGAQQSHSATERLCSLRVVKCAVANSHESEQLTEIYGLRHHPLSSNSASENDPNALPTVPSLFKDKKAQRTWILANAKRLVIHGITLDRYHGDVFFEHLPASVRFIEILHSEIYNTPLLIGKIPLWIESFASINTTWKGRIKKKRRSESILTDNFIEKEGDAMAENRNRSANADQTLARIPALDRYSSRGHGILHGVPTVELSDPEKGLYITIPDANRLRLSSYLSMRHQISMKQEKQRQQRSALTSLQSRTTGTLENASDVGGSTSEIIGATSFSSASSQPTDGTIHDTSSTATDDAPLSTAQTLEDEHEYAPIARFMSSLRFLTCYGPFSDLFIEARLEQQHYDKTPHHRTNMWAQNGKGNTTVENNNNNNNNNNKTYNHISEMGTIPSSRVNIYDMPEGLVFTGWEFFPALEYVSLSFSEPERVSGRRAEVSRYPTLTAESPAEDEPWYTRLGEMLFSPTAAAIPFPQSMETLFLSGVTNLFSPVALPTFQPREECAPPSCLDPATVRGMRFLPYMLQQLPFLRSLTVQNSGLRVSLRHLWQVLQRVKLQDLVFLDVSGNPLLSSSETLSSSPPLEEGGIKEEMEVHAPDVFYVVDCNLSASALQDLKLWEGVRELDMTGNALGPTANFSLFPSSLIGLSVRENNISMHLQREEILAQLPPRIEALDLATNRFYGRLLLGRFPSSLETLDISNNQLSGKVNFSAIHDRLKYLDIHGNRLEGRPNLEFLPLGLRSLWIYDNNWTW